MLVDGDYYGGAVNLAARVAGQARGGQLLVTTHAALAARDLGKETLSRGPLTWSFLVARTGFEPVPPP
jgi:class 3 adenylate cyclase